MSMTDTDLKDVQTVENPKVGPKRANLRNISNLVNEETSEITCVP